MSSARSCDQPEPPMAPAPQGRSRVLRVEFKGRPYDWLNLDEMGEVVRSEDFANTLRENIVHYFNVPFDSQAIFDEDGLLITAVDIARGLQSVRPYFRVYDIRDMPQDLKEQTFQRVAVISYEVARCQQNLSNVRGNPMGPGIGLAPPEPMALSGAAAGCGSRPVSPWPVREPSLADRLGARGGSATPPLSQSRSQSTLMVPETYGGAGPGGCGSAYANGMGQGFCGFHPQGGPCPGMAPAPPPFGHGQGCGLAPCGGLSPRGGPVLGYFNNGMPVAPNGMPGMPGMPGGFAASAPPPVRQYNNGLPRNGWQEPPPRDFEVALSKDLRGQQPERFGFANVPSVDGRSLQVTWIDPNGLLGGWNRTYPDKIVQEGDLILSVNGLLGDVEAMRNQLQYNSVSMRIQPSAPGFQR
ncbi:unnamed protein product [Polarella glacialis]|uniref:PDZ domain-containing protein n=1 Tax=Polarella glacialis TaxID=89957 RepID=A0A813H5G6_POLGL|nr:unnamed protein product [Polarella glacialis]CAE8704962.1 unnamed protein product [Polarella glacialis]